MVVMNRYKTEVLAVVMNICKMEVVVMTEVEVVSYIRMEEDVGDGGWWWSKVEN